MKSKKNLVLLGMMGSGKSTIGELVAKKLNMKLIDIDKVIEKETNMKIAKIFSEKGEQFFRDLEEKITLKSLAQSGKVIALGGGGFINEKIRNEVRKNNFSLWLNWNSYKLINRVKKNKKRPIASNLNYNELKELIEKRAKIYSKAQFKLSCDKLTKTEILNQIVELYEHN